LRPIPTDPYLFHNFSTTLATSHYLAVNKLWKGHLELWKNIIPQKRPFSEGISRFHNSEILSTTAVPH
jgi:hypothetical protein